MTAAGERSSFPWYRGGLELQQAVAQATEFTPNVLGCWPEIYGKLKNGEPAEQLFAMLVLRCAFGKDREFALSELQKALASDQVLHQGVAAIVLVQNGTYRVPDEVAAEAQEILDTLLGSKTLDASVRADLEYLRANPVK